MKRVIIFIFLACMLAACSKDTEEKVSRTEKNNENISITSDFQEDANNNIDYINANNIEKDSAEKISVVNNSLFTTLKKQDKSNVSLTDEEFFSIIANEDGKIKSEKVNHYIEDKYISLMTDTIFRNPSFLSLDDLAVNLANDYLARLMISTGKYKFTGTSYELDSNDLIDMSKVYFTTHTSDEVDYQEYYPNRFMSERIKDYFHSNAINKTYDIATYSVNNQTYEIDYIEKLSDILRIKLITYTSRNSGVIDDYRTLEFEIDYNNKALALIRGTTKNITIQKYKTNDNLFLDIGDEYQIDQSNLQLLSSLYGKNFEILLGIYDGKFVTNLENIGPDIYFESLKMESLVDNEVNIYKNLLNLNNKLTAELVSQEYPVGFGITNIEKINIQKLNTIKINENELKDIIDDYLVTRGLFNCVAEINKVQSVNLDKDSDDELVITISNKPPSDVQDTKGGIEPYQINEYDGIGDFTAILIVDNDGYHVLDETIYYFTADDFILSETVASRKDVITTEKGIQHFYTYLFLHRGSIGDVWNWLSFNQRRSFLFIGDNGEIHQIDVPTGYGLNESWYNTPPYLGSDIIVTDLNNDGYFEIIQEDDRDRPNFTFTIFSYIEGEIIQILHKNRI